MQSGHDSVHRRTEGKTEKGKSVYPPFNFIEAGSINILPEYAITYCMDSLGKSFFIETLSKHLL